METQDFWAGDFGYEYHARNRVDWRRRIKFFREIMHMTGARSVFEWGCGPGWNLTAVQASCGDDVELPWMPTVTGVEINDGALRQAVAAGLDVWKFMPMAEPRFELVMTVGALIHVNPQDLPDMMKQLVDNSCQYVMAVEYHSDEPREIAYRGHREKLWSADYGKLYEGLGLHMVATGGAGDGFDDCTFWLLKK